jgi:DNA-binding response OmpR family regulator
MCIWSLTERELLIVDIFSSISPNTCYMAALDERVLMHKTKRRQNTRLSSVSSLEVLTRPIDSYQSPSAEWVPPEDERAASQPSTASQASSTAMFDAFNVSVYPILIVDDNEGVCILIARMLSNIGFKSIYIANSAKQAYDIFGTQIAELPKDPIIFLDLRLPDVPGEKVAKKIIEIRPSSRIILVTAEDSSAESAQEAMRQGASAYIQKPIGLTKIRNVLASILQEIESEVKQQVQREGESSPSSSSAAEVGHEETSQIRQSATKKSHRVRG